MKFRNPMITLLLLTLLCHGANGAGDKAIQILQIGEFHHDEVPEKIGTHWFALVARQDRTELRAVSPKITAVYDPTGDDQLKKASYTGKKVSVKGVKGNPLILLIQGTSGNSIFVMIARHFRAEEGSLCGINDRLSTKITKRGREKWISGGALQSSSLKTGAIIQASITDLSGGQKIVFGGAEYYFLHKCKDAPPEAALKQCQIFLQGNEITQWIADTYEGDNDYALNIHVQWAGDIDRDGKLDLILDESTYNSGAKTLLLSSSAPKGSYVSSVARRLTTGC